MYKSRLEHKILSTIVTRCLQVILNQKDLVVVVKYVVCICNSFKDPSLVHL